MTATARDLRESPVAGVDPALVQQINAAVDYWWSCQFSACKAVRVPSGPKAGSVVTLGARFRAGGDDQVRDIVIGLLDGESPGHLAGRKFWINALAYQDTFGAELVRRLVTAGRLHPVIVAQVPTAGTFAIDYFEDGHTTFAGNLQSGDPGALSVCYSTGDVITGAGGEQLGARKRSLSIGRVAA